MFDDVCPCYTCRVRRGDVDVQVSPQTLTYEDRLGKVGRYEDQPTAGSPECGNEVTGGQGFSPAGDEDEWGRGSRGASMAETLHRMEVARQAEVKSRAAVGVAVEMGASPFPPPIVTDPKGPFDLRPGGINVFDARTGERTTLAAQTAAEVAEMLNGRRALLPTDPLLRKEVPLATGLIDYFPLALAAVAAVSRAGQKQHGTVGWDRSKSTDESDTLMRHFVERGTFDTDGQRHSAKVAWRALALLQKELEADR